MRMVYAFSLIAMAAIAIVFFAPQNASAVGTSCPCEVCEVDCTCCLDPDVDCEDCLCETCPCQACAEVAVKSAPCCAADQSATVETACACGQCESTCDCCADDSVDCEDCSCEACECEVCLS